MGRNHGRQCDLCKNGTGRSNNIKQANTLTYNGQDHALVNVGTAANGTMQYKLGEDGTYSETIPTATTAGSYTVRATIGETTNYNAGTL